MPPELVTVRCLRDNYAYLLHGNGETALIDAPEAGPIRAALEERGWQLDHILLTHHHDDHIQDVPELRRAFPGVRVTGHAADAARLPPLDQPVSPGDSITICGETATVIDVPGHTIGHIAFHFPDARLAFTGDSLMAIGCGRLFEGGAAMMWDSLSRLNALPGDTLICSGHDYCAGNGAFALSVDPQNAALRDRLAGVEDGAPCAPATLDVERATNPFLRIAELRNRLNMQDAPDAEVFARLRRMKDDF
ncbi:MAG: hydroxyacylglutathione hydrolase [Paracoccus sp. (in: a-proteobacteria)]|uniref:hydroxyacylglutathione hydrolase n=1 Tax=Paracoccus sp. TaxID=267 RepID=UPI0026E0A782|nr:hydroxyacylglutathione hydrolase [Paracoccus sp. (in: a-proteobacteria)]MDO5632850.1 hydroxyacylglutathione hydrolase [Paracoccus sp. (in: a-proteobacteria)]